MSESGVSSKNLLLWTICLIELMSEPAYMTAFMSAHSMGEMGPSSTRSSTVGMKSGEISPRVYSS